MPAENMMYNGHAKLKLLNIPHGGVVANTYIEKLLTFIAYVPAGRHDRPLAAPKCW